MNTSNTNNSTSTSTSTSTGASTSKLTVSPSFKGQFTSIMRQRQLFLDAQRRASSSSSSSSSTSMSTITRLLKSVWTSISSRFRPVADNQQSKSSFYGVLSFSPLAISVIMAMTLGIGIRIGMEIPHQPSSLPTTIPYN